MDDVFEQSLDLIVYGKHPVEAALQSERCRVLELYARDPIDGLKVKVLSKQELDKKAGTDRHQGFVARIQVAYWDQLDDWFEAKFSESKKTLRVLALDGIEDPQNLGALMRSAHFFGFHAVMFPKDRCVQLNSTVAKASTGAFAEIDIIRCTNLARELTASADIGFWRVGLKPEAAAFDKVDMLKKRNVLLVIGSEGEGMRRNIEEKCDELVSIPSMSGRESLNASVAGGIAMFVYKSA